MRVCYVTGRCAFLGGFYIGFRSLDAVWRCTLVSAALILTFAGAAVLHTIKKISLIVDSSMESEAIGSAKAGESVSYAREILRGLGTPPSGPTFVGSDNKANTLLASGRAGSI